MALGYDLVGRGLYARYGSATGPGVCYAYDALGRAVSETEPGGTIAYQYDAAGIRTGFPGRTGARTPSISPVSMTC